MQQPLNELFQQFKNLSQAPVKPTNSNNWATGSGIYQALEQVLGDDVHIIHPDTSSIHSPASTDADNALEGAIAYAKMIGGYVVDGEYVSNGLVAQDGGVLKKPIVMVVNTDTVEALSATDALAEGGHHWQCCVILPKNFKPKYADQLNNSKEIIFYLDSLYQNIKMPPVFAYLLTSTISIEYQFAPDDNIVRTHKIPCIFPNAFIINGLTANQQVGGSDCGWWALYNAIMVVLTGGVNYLGQFRIPSRDNGLKLRTLFPTLELTLELDKALVEEEISTEEVSTEEISETELERAQQALKESLKKSVAVPAKESANTKKQGSVASQPADYFEWQVTRYFSGILTAASKLNMKTFDDYLQLTSQLFSCLKDNPKVMECEKLLEDHIKYILMQSTIRKMAAQLFGVPLAVLENQEAWAKTANNGDSDYADLKEYYTYSDLEFFKRAIRMHFMVPDDIPKNQYKMATDGEYFSNNIDNPVWKFYIAAILPFFKTTINVQTTSDAIKAWQKIDLAALTKHLNFTTERQKYFEQLFKEIKAIVANKPQNKLQALEGKVQSIYCYFNELLDGLRLKIYSTELRERVNKERRKIETRNDNLRMQYSEEVRKLEDNPESAEYDYDGIVMPDEPTYAPIPPNLTYYTRSAFDFNNVLYDLIQISSGFKPKNLSWFINQIAEYELNLTEDIVSLLDFKDSNIESDVVSYIIYSLCMDRMYDPSHLFSKRNYLIDSQINAFKELMQRNSKIDESNPFITTKNQLISSINQGFAKYKELTDLQKLNELKGNFNKAMASSNFVEAQRLWSVFTKFQRLLVSTESLREKNKFAKKGADYELDKNPTTYQELLETAYSSYEGRALAHYHRIYPSPYTDTLVYSSKKSPAKIASFDLVPLFKELEEVGRKIKKEIDQLKDKNPLAKAAQLLEGFADKIQASIEGLDAKEQSKEIETLKQLKDNVLQIKADHTASEEPIIKVLRAIGKDIRGIKSKFKAFGLKDDADTIADKIKSLIDPTNVITMALCFAVSTSPYEKGGPHKRIFVPVWLDLPQLKGQLLSRDPSDKVFPGGNKYELQYMDKVKKDYALGATVMWGNGKYNKEIDDMTKLQKAQLLYHSERVLIELLRNKVTIQPLLDLLEAGIKDQLKLEKLEKGKYKIYSLALLLYSSNSVCEYCTPSIIGMQNSHNEGFLKNLTDLLNADPRYVTRGYNAQTKKQDFSKFRLATLVTSDTEFTDQAKDMVDQESEEATVHHNPMAKLHFTRNQIDLRSTSESAKVPSFFEFVDVNFSAMPSSTSYCYSGLACMSGSKESKYSQGKITNLNKAVLDIINARAERKVDRVVG